VGYLAADKQRAGSTRTLLTEHGDGGQAGSKVRRTVLPGGLRVVSERMPGLRSATLGLWVGVGSIDEPPALAGVTHFLEHVLFKGTARRTALDISAELDAVGGELNAFTGKEYTCYHARVLAGDVPLAVDVLCDMVTSSQLTSPEVESERKVILEEIALHDDDPDDLVHDTFTMALWGDTPLGRPISGTAASISALTRDQMRTYYRRRYTADRLVFSAAGNVDHQALVALVSEAFEAAKALGTPTQRPAALRAALGQPTTAATTALVERPTELASFVLGVSALSREDPRRYALGVLNATLGGGTSSRLFQEVRERRGLAYSVYSFTSQHAGAGYLGVAGGCTPAHLDRVLTICRDQLVELADGGITEPELRRGQGQLRSSLVMDLEEPGARMFRLGKSELVPGGLRTIDDSVRAIDGVTLDEVSQLARDLLHTEPTLAVVGPSRALDRLR
jgi:predicted Zn-dependent peptidase